MQIIAINSHCRLSTHFIYLIRVLLSTEEYFIKLLPLALSAVPREAIWRWLHTYTDIEEANMSWTSPHTDSIGALKAPQKHTKC